MVQTYYLEEGEGDEGNTTDLEDEVEEEDEMDDDENEMEKKREEEENKDGENTMGDGIDDKIGK